VGFSRDRRIQYMVAEAAPCRRPDSNQALIDQRKVFVWPRSGFFHSNDAVVVVVEGEIVF